MPIKSDFINEINQRGFIYQSSDLDEIDSIMQKESITGYIGFDITSDSLHIGSLVQLMLLHWLDYYNHKSIALLGGGTTLVGDPSGKDSSRKILQKDEIDKNISNITKTFGRFINLNKKSMIINNYEWLSNINYIEFLRDFGSAMTLNRMLTFESIKNRLDREQPLSILEFNYMLLQSYDFYYLNKNYNCILQMGGSDQWGNIINGVELIRRILQKDAFGLTTPLITLSSGAKMGKTEKGAVWLDKKLFSAYDYWQFWRNTSDQDVKKFLRYFTEIEENDLSQRINNEQDINQLKILLANEATKILHGEKIAKESEKTAKETFHGSGVGKNLPEINMTKSQIEKGINILDLLSLNNVVSSKSEARRAIQGKGIKINDISVLDEKKIINKDDFKENNYIKISYGKKKHFIIKSV